jgi:hypothetical protein
MKKSLSFTLLMMVLETTALTPVRAQDLVYVPVDPCRIVDTRNAGGAITANTFRNFRVSGTLGELAAQGGTTNCLDPKAGTGLKPLAITAYVLAVPASGSINGVLTAYSSNLPPPPAGSGSTVNFAAGQVIGNTTNITLCDQTSCPIDGEFAVLARSTNQHVVVDVQGYFYPQEVAASSPLFIVDGLGNRIGPAVSWSASAVFLTTTGYFSRVNVGDQQGRPERDGDVFTDHLFYEFPDCAGQPYARQLTLFATGQGVVFAAYTASGSKTLVSAKEATLTTITRQSLTSENGCVNSQIPEQDTAYPVVPNDPNITGLSVTSFPTPITLQE